MKPIQTAPTDRTIALLLFIRTGAGVSLWTIQADRQKVPIWTEVKPRQLSKFHVRKRWVVLAVHALKKRILRFREGHPVILQLCEVVPAHDPVMNILVPVAKGGEAVVPVPSDN